MTGPHVEDVAASPRAGSPVELMARKNGKSNRMAGGTVVDWMPPPAMATEVVRAWRSFYSAAQREYGITAAQYRDLYIAQHGCCYICRKAKGKHPDDPKGRGGRRLGVDHNHVTGAVRGLLCTGGDKTCNRIIGWLGVQALRRAVLYMETEPAQTVLELGRSLDMEEYVARTGEWSRDAMMRRLLGLS